MKQHIPLDNDIMIKDPRCVPRKKPTHNFQNGLQITNVFSANESAVFVQ